MIPSHRIPAHPGKILKEEFLDEMQKNLRLNVIPFLVKLFNGEPQANPLKRFLKIPIGAFFCFCYK